MIHIAVCDDELYMQEELSAHLQDFFNEARIAVSIHSFASGAELLHFQEHLDLILLDIQMEAPDGMETARRLRSRGYNGFLIFVTVLPAPVFDAFEVQAFDYLMKPMDDRKFTLTMQRLLASLPASLPETNLVVQKGALYQLVPMNDIVFCEVINRKIYLHLLNKQVIDYYDTIEQLAQKLNEQFFKCHRSYLINLRYLVGYQNGYVSLKGTDEKIPVSRLRVQALSEAMRKYMKERRKNL